MEILLLFAAGIVIALDRKKARCCFCETPVGAGGDGFIARLLACTLGLLLCLDLAVFIRVSVLMPGGGWDAWAIWNLRAHFLYRAGAVAWRDGFTEALAWSHPDYPLLLPAFVARGWGLLGRESVGVPIALAGFFTFGCAGLMTTSIAILRGTRQGLLAGLALADRFNSRGLAVLAGVAAALGGWAKNEGLLWFGAILLALMIVTRWRLIRAFMAGALPILAPILFFKTSVASSSDIFGAAGRAGMMTRVLDPGRYMLIVREAFLHAWNFGPLLVSAFVILAGYLAVAGLRRDNRDRAILRAGALALVFTAAGYFTIYLVRPLDLAWLLETSSDRLLLQLWPSIVFVIFLACRSPYRVLLSVSNHVEHLPEFRETAINF